MKRDNFILRKTAERPKDRGLCQDVCKLFCLIVLILAVLSIFHQAQQLRMADYRHQYNFMAGSRRNVSKSVLYDDIQNKFRITSRLLKCLFSQTY